MKKKITLDIPLNIVQELDIICIKKNTTRTAFLLEIIKNLIADNKTGEQLPI